MLTTGVHVDKGNGVLIRYGLGFTLTDLEDWRWWSNATRVKPITLHVCQCYIRMPITALTNAD